MKSNLIRLQNRLKKNLDSKRYFHSLRVAKLAAQIADICSADRNAAYLAGLLHDCEKTHDIPDILARAKQYRLRLTTQYKVSPLLMHGPLGAITARKKYGVRNRQILNAIKNHTIGRIGMTKLEKIIYAADYIEAGRRYAKGDRIRKQLFHDHDLNKAVRNKALLMLKYAKRRGWPENKTTLALAKK